MLRAASWLGDNTLPMLDEVCASLRAGGIAIEAHVPEDRSSAAAIRDGIAVDLVWMCGLLVVDLAERHHRVVAAPLFAGETEPVYRSAWITRIDGPCSVNEALGGTVGVNELESWSGCQTLRRDLALRFGAGTWFADQVVTGSHANSIVAVEQGSVDIAGIDETIWRTVEADHPELRAVAMTADAPAPPLCVRATLDEGLRSALVAGLLECGPAAGLDAIVAASFDDYVMMRP